MKVRLFKILILLSLGCAPGNALLDLNYGDYSNVDEKLETGAKSAVRVSDITLEMKSTGEAVYTKRQAITIFDEEHSSLSTLVVYYDQLSKVNSMRANIYDKFGNLTKSYSMDDVVDFSDYDGMSLFTDNRVKVLRAYGSSYPYTVEFEYVKTYYNTLNLPDWFPQIPDQSIEQSKFTLIDHNTGVRYHQKNLEVEPVVKDSAMASVYSWLLDYTAPIELEPFSPNAREILPQVIVAPGTFEVDGWKGNAQNWKDFGQWYHDLGADTRQLPTEAQKEVDALIAGLTDEEEKVSVLYDYLQEKNRYVSIQLGIGGWRPFTAGYVFENSYGDCKALTNYMQAMLEYIGIKAEPVLINASSSNPMIEDFPSNQFNHVILRVTLSDGEIIWLEGTSKYLPPNNLGDGKSKKGLLVTKNGGQVVETPDLDYTQNQTSQKLYMVINADGSATVEADVSTTGANQGQVLHRLLPVSEKERQEWLENNIPVNNRKVISYDFSGLESEDEKAEYSYVASLGNYANASSKRLFVPINKLNEWRDFVPEAEERTQPINFRYPFSEIDTVYYEIPTGFDVEMMPSNNSQETSFGAFSSTFTKVDDHRFVLHRSVEIKEPEIQPENYNELKQFLDALRKADAQQLVLVRRE